MKIRVSLFVLLAFLLASCGETSTTSSKSTQAQAEKSTDTDGYKTIGKVNRLSPQFDQYVKPGATVEVIAEGFDWSEGPLWLPAQQKLIWSDVPRNIIYQWAEGQPVTEYLNPAGYTGKGQDGVKEGSNGLLLAPDGRLVICQHGDRRIAVMNGDPGFPVSSFKTVSGQWNGKRFNSPNDAAYGPEETIYFTDPPYGLAGKDEDPAKEIPFSGVYKTRPDGGAELLDSSLTRPNGIAFNANMTRCYVANSDPQYAIWKVYELDESNNLVNGKVFFDATAMAATNKGLPDGLKVNRQGIIFATGPGGVLVFNPAGEHLGTISTGEAISNCALNEDESVLYMTSDMYVARIRLR